MLHCTQAAPQQIERRAQPRIYRPFPTRVCGITSDGEAFEIDTVVDNLSASGSYLRIGLPLEMGATVLLRVRLCRDGASGPIADIQGVVVRTEPQPEGVFGIALSFRHYRLS